MKELLKVLGTLLFSFCVFLLFTYITGHIDEEKLEKKQMIEKEAYEAGYTDGYNDVYYYLSDNTSFEHGIVWGVFEDSVVDVLYEELSEEEAERIVDIMYTKAFVRLDALQEQYNYSDEDYSSYKPKNTIELP